MAALSLLDEKNVLEFYLLIFQTVGPPPLPSSVPGAHQVALESGRLH